MKFLEVFGEAFVPQKARPNLKSYLSKAGIDKSPYSFFGLLFFLIIIITTILYFMIYVFLVGEPMIIIVLVTLLFWIIFPIFSSFIIMMIIYIFLNLKVYNRIKEIEKMLPDYLQLVSTNLRSGMSFEKSLWFAMRPRFGVLAEEVGKASKKVMTGSDVTDALMELGNKYDSHMLKKTFDLIVSELSSGGEIAKIIDKIRINLKQTEELKEELSASVLTVIIFIGVIVMLMAPGLFALSYQLLGMLGGVTEQISQGMSSDSEMSGSGMMDFSESKAVSLEDFETFSFLALIVIGIFASMITSMVSKGDIKGGLKYIPLYVTIALVVYFIALSGLSGLFPTF